MTAISRLYRLVNVAVTTTDRKPTTKTRGKELKISRKESSRITTINRKMATTTVERVAKKEVRISSSKMITTRLSDRER